MNHAEKLFQILTFTMEQNSKEYEEYLKVLFYVMNDAESEVGLKGEKLLLEVRFPEFSISWPFWKIGRVSKDQDQKALMHKTFIHYIREGMKQKNSILQLRYMELLANLTNISE